MSELALTLLRLGLLVALWLFVFGVLSTLRRDLLAGQRPVRGRASAITGNATRRQFGRTRGANITVTLSDGTVRRLPLGADTITFGRGADNTVILDDDYTSTHHARIHQRDRGWVIEDCGSTNGTWVERKRITVPTPLAAGMRVRIGRTEVAVGS